MDEFDFIAKYLAPLAGPEGLGLLDDAAIFTPRDGYDLVLTKDTMVESVHFPVGVFDDKVAGKLLRVNLSDLAAKGAKPVGYLLSMAMPKKMALNGEALKAFAKGLGRVQGEFDVKLFGGDTVRGTELLTLSATFLGEVRRGKMIKRSGAKAGDDIWVSGTIGDAFLGLKLLQNQDGFEGYLPAHILHLRKAYWSPKPRLELRDILQNYASASADISDGLMADAGHVAKASGAALQIMAADIPVSEAAKIWLNSGDWNTNMAALASGGDDYEIVFTAGQNMAEFIQRDARAAGVRLTKIGRCKTGLGADLLDASRKKVELEKSGYTHF